jgi:hypothetical protein
MGLMLLVGLALVAIFAVPWYRSTGAKSMFALPSHGESTGKSPVTGLGCLGQALFWFGALIAGTAAIALTFQNAAPSPEDRRAIAEAITQQVFRSQEPVSSPSTIEIVLESTEILLQWQVVLILPLYGLALGVIAERMVHSLLSNVQLTVLMTAISYLATTVLVIAIGALILGTGGIREGFATAGFDGERATEIPVRLFWLSAIGLAARAIAAPVSGWSPTFATSIQAAAQLWVFAAFASNGFLARWPGFVFAALWIVSAKLFITLVEALIRAITRERAIPATLSFAGVVAIAPITVYAAWIRLAN